ncbi:MAG: hypothetical protein DELT_00001 [Desulfovibrio sp.]
MLFKVVYGVFLLAVAAILIFCKGGGRRRLVLAAAVSGVMTFALRFLNPEVEPAYMVLLQALVFPFLVLTTWGGLTIISWRKNRS